MSQSDSSSSVSSVLGLFHPLIRTWFEQSVGTPTDIQNQTWPAIASGEHVLVSAPTGSGKTLTAFLWALNQMLTGEWQVGQGIRALYISPLKALNNDINRNLAGPLLELRQIFEEAGEVFPNIRIMTRSGDTPASERSRMIRRPPEILITTPESLNILLTSRKGRTLFAPEHPAAESGSRSEYESGSRAASGVGSVRTVILDEIHAVAGSRRGTHLITAVERLTELTGEFQRIALSATVRPLETIAQFVGGYELEDHSHDSDQRGDFEYRARPVRILESRTPKKIEIAVRSPQNFSQAHETENSTRGEPGPIIERIAGTADPDELEETGAGGAQQEDAIWLALAREFTTIIARNRSTLFFTNSRRLAEKMTRLINEHAGEPLALCHHGSLSREIRLLVEERLKSGSLRAIVATSSLELGIDIGSVDEVILIQTPRSVASTLQRIGRAGHGVGQTSRGAIYPAHSRDILDAALMARAIDERAIEPLAPPRAPLDVIAQVIVSMVANQEREIEEVYARIRCAHSCHELERRAFDLVLEMLAGRYADSRIRELRPRISIDRIRGRIRGRDNVERVLYMSGGTIPDRGYFDLRVSESNAKIGQLDEEFVWERAIGEVFSLGNHHWQIVEITHNDVLVTPGNPGQDIAIVPFWRADAEDRGGHFCDRLRDFLENVNERIESGPPTAESDAPVRTTDQVAELHESLISQFQTRYFLDLGPARRLLHWLVRQRESTGVALPHRRNVVVEFFRDPASGGERLQVILHTFWGGRCNRPLALAFQAAWLETHREAIQVIHNDDAVLLILPGEISAQRLFEMLEPDRLEEYLRISLEPGGFFGARFRESAGRALLLPPSGFGQRLPLWLNRLRSKKLLTAIRRYKDFPILLETWRGCFHESFEIERLRILLEEVRSGAISLSETRTRAASPFAADLVWRDTNVYMYADDSRTPGRTSTDRDRTTLDEQLLEQVVFSGQRRPRISEDLRVEFQAKLQRTAPGYAPRAPVEILEWVKDRIAIPVPEWQSLLESIVRDLGSADAEFLESGEASETENDTQAQVRLAEILAELKSNLVVAVLPGAGIPVVLAAETLGRLAEDLAVDETNSEADRHISRNEWVAQFLRYYGPVDPTILALCFGFSSALSERILRELSEARRIVVAPLRKESEDIYVCDSENLESLLRLLRRRSRPQVPVRPARELPAFLAEVQNVLPLGELVNDGATPSVTPNSPPPDVPALTPTPTQVDGIGGSHQHLERLQSTLEQLMGYPAPAAAWEEEILPARLSPYYISFLDHLFQEHDLVWFGGSNAKKDRNAKAKNESIAFAFGEDLELYVASPNDDRLEDAMFTGDETKVLNELRSGPRSFSELYQTTGLDSDVLMATLWSLTWQGIASNENFSSMRRGILSRFRGERNPGGRRGATPGFGRSRGWARGGRASSRSGGNWFLLDTTGPDQKAAAAGVARRDPDEIASEASGADDDLLAQEEMIRERVRVLFARYGILFRELLANEAPLLRWAAVFRQLRLMELSGEVLGGYFFEGIPGLQFISQAAYRLLGRGVNPDVLYGLAAKDPASLAGIKTYNDNFRDLNFPERKRGVHFVFRGDGTVLMVVRRKLSALDLFCPPGDPAIAICLRYFSRLLGRDFQPIGQIQLATINGQPALKSDYKVDLIDFGFVSDFKYLTLRRTM